MRITDLTQNTKTPLMKVINRKIERWDGDICNCEMCGKFTRLILVETVQEKNGSTRYIETALCRKCMARWLTEVSKK